MTRIVAVGPFIRHAYAHHWKGVRMGFEAIAEGQRIEFVTLDFREVVGADLEDNTYEGEREGAAIAALRDLKPDVVLFGVQDAMTDRMLAAAKDMGAFAALWFCDVRYPADRDLADRLDFLAMTNAGFANLYANAWKIPKERIVWLPQACLPRAGITPPDPAFAADVVHVGSWSHAEFHTTRREVFGHIVETYGVKTIRNDGKAEYRIPEDGSEPTAVFWNPSNDASKSRVTADLDRIYSSAKLAVGISDPIPGYHSNRLFLATGHGACYVCNTFAGIEKLFEPGKEVLAVAQSNIIQTIAEYLELEEDRDRIRQAAFKRAQSDHTYLVRIRELWDCIRRRR